MPDSVRVPDQFAAVFRKAQAYVSRYFKKMKRDPATGSIEIFGERYILVRAASMSVEFFDTIAALYGPLGEAEAQTVARQLLFDLAHALGKQDARNFFRLMDLKDPVDRLSAGPVHFSHAGWAFVDIAAESTPSPDDNYYLLYDHPYSFEAAAWQARGRTASFPVCVMSAGYSSGWCEESFGIPLVATELLCQGKGDHACRFIMAPPSRMEDHIAAYRATVPELAGRIGPCEVPGFFTRIAADRALRTWEHKYHQLFDNLTDAAFLADADTGRIIDTNKQGERLLGHGRDEIIGMHQSELHPPEEVHRYQRIFSEQTRGINATGADGEVLRKDGRIVPVTISASVISEDQKTLMLGLFRDITEQRRTEQEKTAAEDALAKSERRFRSLIENSSDIIIVVDGEWRIRYASPSVKTICGYEVEEVMGRPARDFVHPDDLPAMERAFNALREAPGKTITAALRYRCKEGNWRVLESLSTNLIEDPSIQGVIVNLRDITEHMEHEARIRRLNTLLLAIRSINEHLLVAESEESLYRFVCDTLCGLDNIIAAWIGTTHPESGVNAVAWAGFDEAQLSDLNRAISGAEYTGGFMNEAMTAGQPVYIDDIETDARALSCRDALRKRQVRSLAIVPLLAEKAVIASLVLYSGEAATFDEENARFLSEVSTDIAVGVRSLRLGARLDATLKSLRGSLHGTVAAIARMVELRDPYTAGHQRRVSILARAIGAEMGLPERQVEGLGVAGHIHDIGKIAVPAEILSKPTALSAIEYDMVRTHATAGYEILQNLEFPWPVADAILQHHERLDGSGYPQGLKDGEIILEARILMVADVVESMSSHRPYRPALGMDRALDEIVAKRGQQFDSDVVDSCVTLFREKNFTFDRDY